MTRTMNVSIEHTLREHATFDIEWLHECINYITSS